MNETSEKPKNPFRVRCERMAAAIRRWQETEPASKDPREAAGALEDLLLDEGLLVLPRSVGHGQFRVLVGGKPAPYVGQERPSGPVDAEQAAEMFLVETARDECAERSIVVRPASEAELSSALFGDVTVREEPIRVRPDTYAVAADPGGTYRVLVFADDEHVVQVKLGRELLATLAESLTEEVERWPAKDGGQ